MRFPHILIFIFILITSFGGVYSITHLDISENLDETLPNQEEFLTIQHWMDKQKNIIVFSLDLSEKLGHMDEIDPIADSLANLIIESGLIDDVQYKNDIDPESFVSLITDNLPIYLEAQDYAKIEELLDPIQIQLRLEENKRTLLSPEGIGQRKRILNDPLGFSALAFDSFSKMQIADEIIENGGYFFSQDRSNLLFKGRLNFDISSSKLNRDAAEKLDMLVTNWDQHHPQNRVDYFGTFLVADVNASQIEQDVHTTVLIAVIAIILLLIYYYRKLVILILFLVPGIFGILSAAAAIYILQGQISGLALAASAIVFGIVADYSFHFFTHFKEKKDSIGSRNDIMFPLLISGGTTIVAFMSLLFADSKALQDFGLFTSLSLMGTLFFILTGLPLILRPFEKKIQFPPINQLDKWVDKIKIGQSIPSFKSMAAFLLLTGVMLYFGMDVQFEDDLRKINYYPAELQKREVALQNINPETEQRITILSKNTIDHSTEWNNQLLFDQLRDLQQDGDVKSFFSLAPIMISTEEQAIRIQRWNEFWNGKRENFISEFRSTAIQANWKPQYFDGFYELVQKEYDSIDLSNFIASCSNLSDLTLNNETGKEIITTLICSKDDAEQLKNSLSQIPGTILIDGASVMSKIVESVKNDFNFLLVYAALAVFVAFLFIYGNIELTLISFIPMALSWIWVLGMAALLGIKFNFINIILTTFIFGLGDDFSIFVTDGLIHRYKYKKEVLGQYKTGIILSSISTIIGTGVLIFAKHPALQSIALLSVIGILIIVPITFFIQPVLFKLLISNRTDKGKPPYSIFNIIFSFFGYSIFIAGSLFSVASSYMLRILPLSSGFKKHGTRRILQIIAGFQLDILWKAKKRYFGMENLDFSKPSIIIANHTSFFDILALVRLHPKLVLVVNQWVYNSPLFGPAIRYADYIPSFKNMEDQLPKIKELVAQGFSIAIYPEGRRSEDGKMGRFHKGAFWLAEELQLDITPVFLHGHGYVMPKNEYYLKDSYCDTVVLPRITWDDPQYGSGYKTRTKQISAYFKAAYKSYEESEICRDTAYSPLMFSFYYKSPILPWYFRIKWAFEKRNYENYHQLIGSGAKKIYDLGCGYGYLSYFLWLRNNERSILGYDYDEEKISLSQNSYLKNEQINFQQAKIEEVVIENADAIVLADVLHYLSPEAQTRTLNNCDSGLKPGGIILLRDGIADQQKKHKWTEKSEKWSTQLIKFNKTIGQLHFFTQAYIENWAKQHNYEIETDLQSDKSSNMLFVLRKSDSL
ncbi:1-acyl-sn-glycerol-3-phosphate acyltransferase [Reichenbachiella agarivorans]|uniref:1-acyl-sn-glycerol-3-phosphate acyltransferase n=1 Tax=Reichenbachiella agarivorans TaxID=2979464 RepID=A0ABY6CJR2_9BACT|nr:trifunctional MMPL family transporter/lysophospholipid acyltransferase/class I SAM-dependent methyltransferase [Reichenbachiella agarivorans]UXP30759.1 1-acyl-sn-glycerol-3-phosphate acyltransferase [Reichenbachiella agarivorans]